MPSRDRRDRPDPPDPRLLELADGLYAEPATGFVAARDAVARAADDRELAAAVRSLRKPTVAAWAVNLLVRREAGQIDQVLDLAASLRAAAEALDGAELRALTRQRRQLTAALATSARGLAREHGVRLTPSVADQVEGMLTAAMLDPVAADVVRSGLVLTAFTSTGVSEVDVATVCAIPEALGHRAAPTERPPLDLQVVAGPTPQEALRAEVAELRAAVERARTEHDEVDARRQDVQAQRLQVRGELDEAQRRVAALEESDEALGAELDEATDDLATAVGELRAVEAALAAAEERLGG